ncbi:MAG TPA: YncE family protein [Pyrinomonadaceae bacterium]
MAIPLSLMIPEDLQQYTVPLGLDAFLENVLYEDMAIRQGFLDVNDEAERDPDLPAFGPLLGLHFKGRLADNLGLALPSVGGLELVLGAGRIGFDADVDFEADRISITLSADVMRLRFARSLLQPVVQKEIADPNDPTGQHKLTIFVADPDETKKIELAFQVAVSVDETGSIQVRWPENSPESITLPPAMIGDTRVVVQGNLGIDFSTDSALPNVSGRALDPAWVGVVVRDFKLYLPPDMAGILPEQLSGSCLIGSRGLSAMVRGQWLDAAGKPTAVFKEVRQPDGSVKRFYEGPGSFSFFGLPGAMRSLELDVDDNVPVRSEIDAEFVLPFFETPIATNVGFGLDGSVDLELRSADPNSQLVKVRKEGLLELSIASLGVQRRGDLVKFGLSGEVKPLIPGVDWPSFKVDELSIDTKGHVLIEGGWLNLRETYQVNFHGFQIEISKLGFGNTENGGKWIGFTGGVKLVAGMPAGASVEGLRFTWFPDGHIEPSLNGVAVNFEIPKTLKFAGEVSYDPQLEQFRGAVKLDLMALKMEVDATAIFKMHQGQPCLALYLAAEFPAGIPLFATGLGVYGMAGLFAMNMEPNRQASQPWYQLGSHDDWYHTAPTGVTSLSKWTARPGSMAFGAGVTLGTVADNGHTFSGKMLLAIVFPGPILLIQGSASILHERAALEGDDANFRALAVLDGRAGTFTLGLDAQYRYDDSGALIDIHGAAEGYFNFNDPKAWHLNVGLKDPRERRLTARLFKLFDSYSYLTLDAQQLAMGAWIGFKKQWQFGPLSVALEAWIDGNARVSWKPAHFYGDLSLHGSAKLAVFGFGVGLTVDAKIAADVFDPLHVLGQFNVAIDLPWPFSDIAVNVKLEWGPQPTRPPLPLPVKEVAIEHFKASTSWPLPRAKQNGLLLPNYDDNGDGFFETPKGGSVPVDMSIVPIVPLDSRPHVTFARSINDDALVGVNTLRVVPEFERIGDPVRNQGPARVRYGLQEVALEKFKNGTWSAVARKATDANQNGVPTLFGSWAPMPQMPGGGGLNVGQTKLWLWSKTPFEYSRRSSRAWDEWFTDEHNGYPCQGMAGTGWDFEKIDPGPLPGSWKHPDEPGLVIDAAHSSVVALSRPSHGLAHALGIGSTGSFMLERPTNVIRIMITDGRLYRDSDFTGRDANMKFFGAVLGGTADRPYIEIRGTNIVQIDYFAEVFLQAALNKNVAAAIGGAYIPSLNRLVFVEFASGNLSAIDLITNDYIVLGRGYETPEDVVVTANGQVAYVTERTGALLRVPLTGNANRANATVVSKGMTAPSQIALDEAGGKAYVVEYDDFSGNGRLLSIDLDGPTAGTQTVLATGLDQAVGLLLTEDISTAYVSEQGSAGRILRIDLATGKSAVVAEKIPAIFFLRWANAAQDAILVVQRDPINSLVRVDLNKPGAEPERIMENLPTRPSSVVILPDDRYAVCCDQELIIFTTTLFVPRISDVGGDLLVRHFEDELARWSQVGEVLEPHTLYRLKVKTKISARGEGQLAGYSVDQPVEEFAYFQTDGPPGVARLTSPLSPNASSSAPGPYEGPLDDLSRYVRKTMPRVLSSNTPRPFYRAYDVGIEFDENYVDLMYRIGRRDLSIHLYDGNGAIRDDQGRRLVLANQWGRAEQVNLSEREERWLSVLGSSGCALINEGTIVKDSTFNAPHEPHLMSPAASCEARLIPALLHDDFGGYTSNGADGPNGSFERWQVRDDAGSDPSQWRIKPDGKTPPDLELIQFNNKATTTVVYQNTFELPPDHSEQPSKWTDYRLTVGLRHKEGKIGMVFRYRDSANYYRFVLDASGISSGITPKSQLFRVVNGASTPLATGDYSFKAGDDHTISVEAVGPSLRVYLDDNPPLEVSDSAFNAGSVGLYSSGNSEARFTDVYVDDFRNPAPVVYRHSFLTSRFRNFVDHLNSFDKKTWGASLTAANVASLIAAAASPTAAVSDAESRAYDALLAQLSNVVAPSVVQVTRVEQGGSAIAFLVQSPEGFDWSRMNLQLLHAQLGSKSYEQMTALVLRKSDGAGVFIVSPSASSSGSLLPPGEYRVVWTYRRDNRAVDTNSDVLSEAGNSAPEEVSLDLPWQTQ